MVTLPETTWGDGDKRALLLHGINGAGAGWWRVGRALAANGWTVTAVDMRGHGTAPLGDSYLLADYVADLPGTGWDLVGGHSLGAAVSVIACNRPGFAKRQVLFDPVLLINDSDHDAIHEDQAAELTESLDELAQKRPLWHPLDVELKYAASQVAHREVVDGTFSQNRPWDLLADAHATVVPTLILAADPEVYTMFTAETEAVVSNPSITVRRIAGAGHSPHRDQADETIATLLDWL